MEACPALTADGLSPPARDLARLLNLMQTSIENTASSDLKSGSSSAPETSAQGMSSFNYEVSQARSSAFEPVNVSAPQSAARGFVGPGPSGTSLMDYVRMVDKMGQEVLFELKGHAHLGQFQTIITSCIILMQYGKQVMNRLRTHRLRRRRMAVSMAAELWVSLPDPARKTEDASLKGGLRMILPRAE